jgi:hypothetical protein
VDTYREEGTAAGTVGGALTLREGVDASDARFANGLDTLGRLASGLPAWRRPVGSVKFGGLLPT